MVTVKFSSPSLVARPRTSVALASGAVLAASALLFACAGSEVPVDDAPIDAGSSDGAAPRPSATTPPRDAAPPSNDTCSPCSTDDDCKRTCGAVSSGSFCCDVQTKKCYRTTGSSCPVPVEPSDAAPPPGPY